MPIERPAAAIDPSDAMRSRSAILPGPTRPAGSRSTRSESLPMASELDEFALRRQTCGQSRLAGQRAGRTFVLRSSAKHLFEYRTERHVFYGLAEHDVLDSLFKSDKSMCFNQARQHRRSLFFDCDFFPASMGVLLIV